MYIYFIVEVYRSTIKIDKKEKNILNLVSKNIVKKNSEIVEILKG